MGVGTAATPPPEEERAFRLSKPDEVNRRSGAFLLALALLTVAAPLAAWLCAPPETMIGYCGVARGEFENWAWMDWWLPRHVIAQAALHGDTFLATVRAALHAPRDLDFGNYLDGLLITQPLKLLLGPVSGHNVRIAVILTLNALAGITYWFMAIFLAPLALLVVWCRLEAWRGWLTHLGVAAVLVAPFAWPFLDSPAPHSAYGTPFPPWESLRIPAPGVLGPPGPGLVVAQSVDLSAPLRPPLGPSLPWVAIALAALSIGAWKRQPRMAGVLVGCALLWWGMSLGPHVRFHGGVVLDGYVYQWAYRWVPFLWRLSWPARTLPLVSVISSLLLVPALAGAYQAVASGISPTRQRWALHATSAGLAAFVLVGTAGTGLLPLPVTPLRVPAPYRDGSLGDPREGLIELSFPPNSGPAAWYQSWHGHPVLGGQAFSPSELDRLPMWARDPALLQSSAILAWADATRASHRQPPFPQLGDEAARLAQAGFPWIVVQRTYGGAPIAGTDLLAAALTRHLGPPVIEVPEMCAWRLEPASLQRLTSPPRP